MKRSTPRTVHHRGDTITTAGATGLYVGTTAAGVVWIAYPGDDFDAMCAHFDGREARAYLGAA